LAADVQVKTLEDNLMKESNTCTKAVVVLLALLPFNVSINRAVEAPAVADAAASSADPNAHLDYAPGKAPQLWSVATAETIMARWPDYNRAYHASWTYVHGYALYGFEMLYRATGFGNQDNMMTGNPLVMLYEVTKDKRYIKDRQSINAKEAVAGFLWATEIVERPQLEKARRP
jgi:hypothetical protein